MTAELVTHTGGCHCGAVRFACEAPAEIEVLDCNCSICRLLDYRHLVVPKDRFTLLSGDDQLARYRFNTRVAEHLFCKRCGVKSFYVPRSDPEAISVNARCLDPGTVTHQVVIAIDGSRDALHNR